MQGDANLMILQDMGAGSQALITAHAEGYALPKNLDKSPPQAEMALETKQDLPVWLHQ